MPLHLPRSPDHVPTHQRGPWQPPACRGPSQDRDGERDPGRGGRGRTLLRRLLDFLRGQQRGQGSARKPLQRRRSVLPRNARRQHGGGAAPLGQRRASDARDPCRRTWSTAGAGRRATISPLRGRQRRRDKRQRNRWSMLLLSGGYPHHPRRIRGGGPARPSAAGGQEAGAPARGPVPRSRPTQARAGRHRQRAGAGARQPHQLRRTREPR